MVVVPERRGKVSLLPGDRLHGYISIPAVTHFPEQPTGPGTAERVGDSQTVDGAQDHPEHLQAFIAVPQAVPPDQRTHAAPLKMASIFAQRGNHPGLMNRFVGGSRVAVSEAHGMKEFAR